MAFAKSASIAEGPALNAFHSIRTPGPRAFSNWPLARPISACAWVRFGKYPTRITVGFCCAAANVEASIQIAVRNQKLAVIFFFCNRMEFVSALKFIRHVNLQPFPQRLRRASRSHQRASEQTVQLQADVWK